MDRGGVSDIEAWGEVSYPQAGQRGQLMSTRVNRRGRWSSCWMTCSAAVVAAGIVVGALAGCSADDNDAGGRGVDLTAVPAPVQWVSLAGVKVPGGAQGPASSTPVRHGYEHSPQGAVLAAVNGQALMSLAGNDKTQAVSDYVLAPGAGRDQWGQARALADVSGMVDPDTAPRFAGFKITNYSDESVQVIVAAEYAVPERWTGVYPVQLRWINDDWRVVAPTREDGVHVTPVDSTDDFTSFAAQVPTLTSAEQKESH